MSLTQQIDYFGKLSAQFPTPRLRVIYSASGTIPAAAILRDQLAVVEHKLYWAPISTLREGRYMLAILNSEVTRAKVAPHQSRGQWGARDFDKLLAEAIPQFGAENPLHLELAKAAESAEKVAARTNLPGNIHFTRARKLIRDALGADGISKQIDVLVSRLFDTH
jgi:hypothetical protein